MLDMSWRTSEAQELHEIFQGAFFSLVTALLLLAIVLDYKSADLVWSAIALERLQLNQRDEVVYVLKKP